jgi:hypothetical protein
MPAYFFLFLSYRQIIFYYIPNLTKKKQTEKTLTKKNEKKHKHRTHLATILKSFDLFFLWFSNRSIRKKKDDNLIVSNENLPILF